MIGLIYRVVTRVLYWVIRPWVSRRDLTAMWRQRMGYVGREGPCDIWLHASSVGEVRVVTILARQLLERRPELDLHVTVMTPAGMKAARGGLADAVSVSFLPIDAVPAVRRAMGVLQPKMLVIAETEIWPVLVREASLCEVPIVLVNGRMSSRAFGRYVRLRGFFGKVLAEYDRLFVKSQEDMARFAQFGVGADRADVTGDMKFDAPLYECSAERRDEWRRLCGADEGSLMWVAGSTRSGEEAMLLDLWPSLREHCARLILVLVPRHVQRAEEIVRLIEQRALAYSELRETPASEPLVLAAKMGILNDLYAAGDIAFVGGTLVDIGGHNILEPVWAQTPVLYGPSIGNVTEAASYVEERGYGAMVADATELGRRIRSFCAGHLEFATRSETAEADCATARVVEYILKRTI
jgi:3-deoxy-D-manno-octulosonic-acid transferase